MWKRSESSIAAMGTMVVEGGNKPKRLKFQEMVEKGEEDRISALPDSLLVEILSRLPSTKGAIRTGSLSKRWKHVWTSVPSLYFNEYTRPLSDFFSNVEKTLTQRRQLKLKKFVVRTNYDIRFKSQVNNWIRYAIRCDVEELNFSLESPILKAEFVLDQFFFICSCFTDLKLQGCIFNPVGAISWKNLRSLSISDGNLNEDLFENISAGSPQLETLVLTDCYGYRHLNIASKSVKNLEFHGDMVGDDEIGAGIIEINAPNILSLTIKGELVVWQFLLVNVSSLVKVDLDYSNDEPVEAKEEMLKGYIQNLRHVKEIKIGFSFTKVVSRLEAKAFAFPSNVNLPVATYDWSESDSESVSDSAYSDSVSDSADSDTVSDSSDGVGDSSESEDS